TPLQEGMLFHRLVGGPDDVYVDQAALLLEGVEVRGGETSASSYWCVGGTGPPRVCDSGMRHRGVGRRSRGDRPRVARRPLTVVGNTSCATGS
ncbi:hypothetical protein, partial [Streptomyces sp. NPDC005568]|uniref:hypothetical protein n=1 Tax=Streptomyces sp. NPDC005568 TaxID=3156887 RepID=UPI0033A3375A